MKYLLVLWLIYFCSAAPGDSSPEDPKRCMKYVDIAFEEINNIHNENIRLEKIISCVIYPYPGIQLDITADISHSQYDIERCKLNVIGTIFEKFTSIEIKCPNKRTLNVKVPKLIDIQYNKQPEESDENYDYPNDYVDPKYRSSGDEY